MTQRILARSLVVFGLALFVVGSITPAFAGARDHADGFFMRLSAGGGSSKTRIESGDEFMEFSGKASDLNFAFGAIVAPNLALHGTLYGWMMSDPDMEARLSDEDLAGEVDGDFTTGALGIGLTYYLMPANVYFSGTIGRGSMNLDLDGSIDGETDYGLIFDLTIGKEWWVGDGWGLGAALGMTHHSFSDPDVDENWSGTSYALRFTATMN